MSYGTLTTNTETIEVTANSNEGLHVQADGTWGGGTLAVEEKKQDGTWKPVRDSNASDAAIEKTSDFDIHLKMKSGDTIRLALSGATGADIDWQITGGETNQA